ncbi:NAD kinase [Calidifontibacillus erzurumensis]|uniref:NAD kinase n=1 Tax=Calidifontibacillus erzurumensis TaxID=2741433 RepID=A0A8J8GF64_9BACI|nr:NAD kinase [Calidifontibacillus erzurumensis]NSL51303.1 NAD kinase [Calidifontibacillus erzurumensis]
MSDLRNIFFFYKPTEKAAELLKPLFKIMENHGFTIVHDYRKANIIASIGGDGTFLQAIRKSGFREDCLYIAINDTNIPMLYADFSIHDTDKIVDAIINNNVEVRRYPTILATIDGHTSFYCLNECTVRSSIIKTFVLDVYIDDLYFETFRGDGMIVSTPTGSTGYSKSVKGAVIDPLLPCFQVSELASLNNNAYRTLGASFILSGDRKLTLKLAQDGNDYPVIGMDNEALSIQHVEKIEVSLGDRKIKTIKLKDNSFWQKVKRKFL